MRHSVVWAANSVEPDSQGEWVKWEELDKANKLLREQKEEILRLLKANEQVSRSSEAECQSRDSTIVKQANIIKAAKERLNLLGHSPNCGSRYSKRLADGVEKEGHCDCGLNDWLKESGVG